MANTGCCQKPTIYSVRSYNLDGTTRWIQNYYDGSNGVIGTGLLMDLRCAVDSQGNVYVAGPTITAAKGDSTWSLVSYDSDGQLRWKKDIRKMIRDVSPVFAAYSGNLWDVVVMQDDRILCVGDPTQYIPYLINQWGGFTFTPDGELTTQAPLNAAWYNRQQEILLCAVGDIAYGRPLAPTTWGGMSSYAFCARDTEHYISDSGLNAYQWYSSYNPTLIQVPKGKTMHPGFPDLWDWAFWGSRFGNPGDGQFYVSFSTIAASPDASKVYASGANIHGVLSGLGVQFNVARLMPDIGYIQSRGVGLEPFFDTAPFPDYPVSDGSDSIIWGRGSSLGTEERKTDSIGVDGGVIMVGNSTRLKFYDQSDGSKVWAHNHHEVTGIARTQDGGFVTVGAYATTDDDESFI